MNDTYGHSIGDEVLKNIAKSIEKSIRRSDIAARFGGDEFVIIFSSTELSGALLASKKISNAIKKKSITKKGEKIKTSASIGVSEMETGLSLRKLIDKADQAMYRAKDSKKVNVST